MNYAKILDEAARHAKVSPEVFLTQFLDKHHWNHIFAAQRFGIPVPAFRALMRLHSIKPRKPQKWLKTEVEMGKTFEVAVPELIAAGYGACRIAEYLEISKSALYRLLARQGIKPPGLSKPHVIRPRPAPTDACRARSVEVRSKRYLIGGVEFTLKELAEKFDMTPSGMRNRIEKWGLEEALKYGKGERPKHDDED